MWTLLNKVTKHWNLLTKYWRQPPLTLIHGDAHLGNVYFRDDGTAGFYDWQLVNANTPLCDVSYFLFFAVSPNDLKANDIFRIINNNWCCIYNERRMMEMIITTVELQMLMWIY